MSCQVVPVMSYVTGCTIATDGWAEGIEVATIDAFHGYAIAVGDVLPDATSVIDHLDVIRLASAAAAHLEPPVRRRLGTPPHRARCW